jgi:transcriptional regulator with XRE-family HTH domain
MTPLERRAAFKAAVTLQQTTSRDAARSLGVSYNHLTLVLKGERQGSDRLERAIAVFLGRPRDEVFSDETVRI